MMSYHPMSGYPGKDATTFIQQISNLLNTVPKENILVMDTNLSASIQMRETNSITNSDENNPSVNLRQMMNLLIIKSMRWQMNCALFCELKVTA